MRAVVVCATLLACTADEFVGGDATTDATTDGTTTDAGASDVSEDAIQDGSIGQLDGCNYTFSTSPCGAVSCAPNACCLETNDAGCESACKNGDALGCRESKDCLSEAGFSVCCLADAAVTVGCPNKIGVGAQSSCVSGNTCGTGDYRLCGGDLDCQSTKCNRTVFTINPNYLFGICQP